MYVWAVRPLTAYAVMIAQNFRFAFLGTFCEGVALNLPPKAMPLETSLLVEDAYYSAVFFYFALAEEFDAFGEHDMFFL